MKPILEIDGISKKFRINHELHPYLSLRDRLAGIFNKSTETEDFWALDGVSFNVNAGETIGLIGRNGAGKSTLLKILSRITPPTKGKIISRGRVASLLEVGTGFHPELSGRENVFMNGSILGMKKIEIKNNFDAIVDFSGVEKFIDTPLKHYSSGMQLRLAFAVAAFLENEVLIVDEVLAVGDAEFQKKCMGKMNDISKVEGRTLIFVSHQLGAVSKLCSRTILLSSGKVQMDGKTDDVIDTYLRTGISDLTYEAHGNNAKKSIYFNKIFLSNQKGAMLNEFSHDEAFVIHQHLIVNEFQRGAHVCIALLDKSKNRVFSIIKNLDELKERMKGKELHLKLKIPGRIIAPNNYSLLAAIYFPTGSSLDWQEDICPLQVIDSGTEFASYQNFGNVILHDCEWSF